MALDTTVTPTQGGNKYVIALVAALGLIPIALDTTIVTVALTPIREALGSDVETVQWIVTAYFLASAAVVAIGGYLAGRFGRKRLFVLGLILFTVGSALCAVAPSMGWLIAFRALQGVGGGVLLPIGPALAFDGFPQNERARASALIGVPLLLAPVFGPIIGGYLTDTFNWHSIFIVNLPVGVIALVAALLALPADSPRSAAAGARRPGFDVVGLTLSTLGVITIVYALTLVTRTNPSTVTAANPSGDLYGWGYWLVWTLLGVGVVALAIFAFYSLRLSRDPALDLRQFARYDFAISSVFTWTTAMFSFGLLVLLPLYFESIRQPGLSAADTGLALVPFGVGAILGTIISAILYRPLGVRLVVLIGAALSAGAAWLLTQSVHPTASASQLLAAAQAQATVAPVAGADATRLGLFLVGLSLTFMSIPLQTLALEALTSAALEKASSLFLSTKLIFSSVGVAILTTLLVSFSRSRATDLVNQLQALAQSAGASPTSPQAVAALHALLGQVATQAGTWAVQSIFTLIFFASLGMMALALALPGRRRSATTAAQPEAAPAQSVGV